MKVDFFHPVRLADLGLVNNRPHRKLAVIDARLAYVFGHGIAEEWTGEGEDEKHWRDTGVRLEGPIVNFVQAAFAENWVDTTAEVLIGDRYSPLQPAVGPVRAHTAGTPRGGVSRLELQGKRAIASAQKRLFIQNPYFIPDPPRVDLLAQTVRRGVDVLLMIPGPTTDNRQPTTPSSVTLAIANSALSSRRGSRSTSTSATLSHQKVMIVDGLWSLVGSTNFDDRSLNINDEASVGMIDDDR